MKKKIVTWLMCFLMAFVLFPVSAHADTGPKPSVCITFKNMGDEVCYGTLLSKTDSTGPAWAWDGNPQNIHDNGLEKEIWQAFVDYEDTDGYYFLQWGWECSETKELNWMYYPPYSFKILLYYPRLDTYAVSEIYERYAFDSYFVVDMDGVEIGSVKTVITAEKSYDFTWEIISLVCRVVITILLELVIAWVFGLRQKKVITTILWVNLVTQIGLNVLLNIINYNRGSFAFVGYYVFLEFVVFIVEAALYVVLFHKNRAVHVSNQRFILYALVANAVSFIGGMGIAQLVPGIF